MRTDSRRLGWGWSIRALAGFIGVALAYSNTTPAVRAQAGTSGQWRTLNTTMPINPVHAALMNNGKVLIVSGSGNVAAETNFQSGVFDPIAETMTVTSAQPWDMFCNGMVVLLDGRPFVNGGTIQYDPFHGQPKNAVFDPATGLFTDVQPMAHGRWYPTVTTLSDGRVMTFSGLDENGNTNTTVEIYTVGSGWSGPYTSTWTPPLYPRMHLLPDGNVLYSGSGTGSRIFNTTSKTWGSVVATTNSSVTRTYGSSVLLPLRASEGYKARVMIFGGGSPAISSTEILDTSALPLHWQNGPNMSQGRIEMNATILPNGKVLATGGSTTDENATTKSLNADLFDASGWPTVTVASAGANAYARLYHSNALLLPDATVLLLGGNPTRGAYETQMEIYSPAYLFDSNGNPALRPAITANPGPITHGGSFQIQTPDAADIRSVVLVRPGAPTHAFDMDQRLIELPYSVAGGQLTATAPPNGNIAPPGYYMLFILNSAGVPSVARFVQLMSPAVNQAPAITSGSSATFTVGAAGSFTVTATGVPTPSVSESGALPSGVTFVNNGNGTATLSGTPASGMAGTYAITMTASNGVTPAATQSFTLTVTSGGGGGGNFAYVTGSVTGIVDFGGDTGATLSVALHQAPGAGHLLVCAATWQSATATAAMSDPNNGTWTPIGTAKTGAGGLSGYRGQMFYVPAAANAATTVTLTLGSAVAFRTFECAEFAYTGTIATLDGTPQYSTTPAAGGVATVSGLTTTNAGDLVLADCLGVDTTCTTGAGFTGLDDTNAVYKDRGGTASFLSGTGQLIEFKVGVAAGAQSATFRTGTTTDNVILGLVAF